MKKIDCNKEYIILEIIPTALDPNKGKIVQLSALKLKGLELIDRFDYRLEEKFINNIDILNMINYDRDKFVYIDDSNDIINEFIEWAGDIELLIIDNNYTRNYLRDISNEKESIFDYLGFSYSDDVIDKIVSKYNLEPSNHIVDLLYEGLIYESNNR